jgi:hypothetical protein
MGQPTAHADPFATNTRIEQAYFELKIQKLDLDVKVAKLERDNFKLKTHYKKINLECLRIKEENKSTLQTNMGLHYDIQNINYGNMAKNQELMNHIYKLEKDLACFQNHANRESTE